MNYYNPYYFANPSNIGYGSLFSSIGRNFSFGRILNGAQRALGLFNQALPIIKEAAPMMRNARTMFKVMNEFKKIDTPISKQTSNEVTEEKAQDYMPSETGPTFFA